MAVVDVASMDYIDYEAFWFHREKKRPIKGLMGLGNSDCSKIFATGFDAVRSRPKPAVRLIT